MLKPHRGKVDEPLVSEGRALAVAAALVLGLAAPGAASASAPPPDPSKLVLAASDFANAKVASQSKSVIGSRSSYIRVFRPGSKLGARPLVSVVAIATVYADAAGAQSDFDVTASSFRTKASRMLIAKVYAKQFKVGVQAATKGKTKTTAKLKRAVVGPPVTLGPDAVRVPLTMKMNVGPVRMDLVFLRVDRVFVTIELAALLGQKIDLRDVARAVAAERTRVTAALTVASSAPPVVSGTAARGQQLTADTGDWTGSPSDFAYAWSRCDTGGTVCAPIDGATSATYTPGDGDAGSTLRVTVTASNTVSSQQATSTPTAVVP